MIRCTQAIESLPLKYKSVHSDPIICASRSDRRIDISLLNVTFYPEFTSAHDEKTQKLTCFSFFLSTGVRYI